MGVTEREFIEAYEAHWAKIFRYCLFRTNSRPEAEDLTAEVFRKLLESRKQPEPGFLLPWLYRVARNLCVNHRSRQSRRELLARILGRSIEPPPSQGVSPWRDPDLLAAVRRLKPREQHIVFLRVIEDLSFAEVAETLEMSEGAAKVAFHRSMRVLRRLLEDDPPRRAALADLQGENYGH
jgi:RNA polymerase sigma factor (sigma-70 family)